MQRSFGQNAVDFLGLVKQRFYGRRSLLLFLVFLVPFLNALISPPQAVSAANTGLIISPDADGQVDMSVSGISKYETFAGHPAANATQAATDASAFKNWETWKKSTHTYVNFKSGPHMHGIGFTGEPMTSTKFSVVGKQISGTISLNYHNIGLYNFATTGKPNLQTVGAKITITNIVTGPQPSFGGSTRPYIVFSDNLYSGVVYGGIKSMTMTVEVYNAQTGATVNFGSDNSSVFGFNSLNHNDNQDQYAEFASSGSGVAGQLSSPTNMKKAGAGGVVSGAGYSKNAYWGSSNNFADHLGSATFEKNAVSFPMHGTSNTFTFGSLYGRAWNAFSSSAVYPTYQNMPTKTVEPVKQFVTGDPWYQYTGSDNGWEQRYDNDLDRYHVAGDGVAPDFGVTNDVNMPWDFTNPQVGHNPDTGSLYAGVLPKAERYVVNGGSYYYYINQPTINLQTQGLILPSGYEISDQLPAGTTFESATLYNLNGTIISNPFSNQPSAGASKLNFKFTDAATNAINEASRIEANFGKDFTLRIRFKVNNVANTDNINDVMSNKATSKFHYTQLGNETYDADSNAVQIKVKDALVKLDFIKQDEAGQPLAGAIFGLFDKDGSKQIGENITSDKDGKFSFSGKTSELPDGTYILKEITPPSGYDPVGEIKVFVENG